MKAVLFIKNLAQKYPNSFTLGKKIQSVPRTRDSKFWKKMRKTFTGNEYQVGESIRSILSQMGENRTKEYFWKISSSMSKHRSKL